MIGAIFLLLAGGSLFGTAIVNNATDNYYKKTRKIDGTNLYIDHRQISRDIDTGEIMNIGRNRDNDRCLYNDVFHIVRNLDQDEREKQYKELKFNRKDGITVFKVDSHRYSDCGKLRGYRYKDLETGKDFVIRMFWVHWWNKAEYKEEKFNTIYYLDMEGNLIRPIDGREKLPQERESVLIDLWEKYKKTNDWITWTNDSSFINLDMWTT